MPGNIARSTTWHDTVNDRDMRRENIRKLLRHFMMKYREKNHDVVLTIEQRLRIAGLMKKLEARIYFTSPSREQYLDKEYFSAKVKHVIEEVSAIRTRRIAETLAREMFICAVYIVRSTEQTP